MRIVHVVPSISVGGVWRLLRALEQFGASSESTTVVSLFDLDEQQALQQLRCKVVRLRYRIDGEGLRERLASTLASVFERIEPALVQSHHIYSDIFTLPVCGRMGIKALRMVHGITQARESAPLDRSEVKLDWDGAEIQEELGLESFCSGTLAVSSALCRRLVSYGFTPGSIRVVHPGVPLPDLETDSGKPAPGSRRGMTVGFAGRLENVKNPALLPEVSRELERMGVNARFVVVGEGRQKAELIRKVEDLGQSDYFRFLPLTGEIDPVLATFDTVLLTSFSEGLPMVMLEAMALGIPVVAADVGGVGEAIRDGLNGFLCPPGDARSFAERVAALAQSEDLRATVCAGARETVRRSFTVERYVKDMVDAYSRVLAGRPLVGHEESPHAHPVASSSIEHLNEHY